MDICLYCVDQNSDSPVEKYLTDKFGVNYSIPSRDEVIPLLTEILSKWIHVAEENGFPDGHLARKMRDYDFIEIRVKDSRTLIRFPYYRDLVNNRMVILSGYEKESSFKKKGKEARRVEVLNQEAQKYYENYHKDKNKYKDFPINSFNL